MPKNIIVYRDQLIPNSETFVLTQLQNFSEYTPYLMGYKKVENSLDFSGIKSIINNVNAPTRNTISEVALKKIGLNPKLYFQAKKVNPLLIHAQFGPDGVLAMPFAKQLKIPLIVTFHGYDVTVKDEYLSKQSFNVRHYVKNRDKLAKTGDLFIAASNFLKNKLIEKGFPEEKIITNYIGVDLRLLNIDEAIQRKNAVLFVGRLIENKGWNFLLEAMDHVFEQSPDVELWIVGNGPDKEKLEKKVEKYKNKVKIFGTLPYSEVIRLMNTAKVLSVPSVEVDSGASEGFGMVFAEANAMGLPVASFKTGGIPEAVVDGETGLLVEPKDVRGLAQAIIRILNNDEMWQKMSSKGIQRVHSELDIVKQTKKLELIYDDFLSQTKNNF